MIVEIVFKILNNIIINVRSFFHINYLRYVFLNMI